MITLYHLHIPVFFDTCFVRLLSCAKRFFATSTFESISSSSFCLLAQSPSYYRMQVCLISDRRSNLVKTSQRVADVHKSLLLIYPSRLLRTFTCKYLLLHVVEVSVRLFRQILRIHIRAHQLIPTPYFPSNISHFIFKLPPLLANLVSHSFCPSSHPHTLTFSRRSPSIMFVRRFTSRSVLPCHPYQQPYSLYLVVSCDMLVRSDCILRILFSTISNCVCTFANYGSTR